MGCKAAVICIFLFLVFFTFFYTSITPLHEWLHLTVGEFFGGEGIILHTSYGGSVHYTVQPSHFGFDALIGGVGVASIYTALLIVLWFNRDAWNPEIIAALMPCVTMQLGYGVFEGVFLTRLQHATYIYYGGIVSIVCFTVGAVPALILFFMQLQTKVNQA